MINEVILKNISKAFTGTTPVKAIYKGTNKIWESGLEPETYTLIEDSYIEDAAGYYHQKLVKYGEFIPGVNYETPGSTYTGYVFVDDTDYTGEKLEGYAYLMSDNKNKHNTWAQVKLYWEDIEDFTLYYRSYAESNYDYIVISQVDADAWTSLPSYSGSLANTRGNQSLTYSELNLSGSGSHHLWVAFRKDSSASSNQDRGYIYFKKSKQEILDVKSGSLLPYEYVWYGDVIIEGEKVYKKDIYTAKLPNGTTVKNEELYVKGEELELIKSYGGLTLEGQGTTNTVSLKNLKSGVSLQYAIKDKSYWATLDTSTTVSLNQGDKMYVRGINNSVGDGNNTGTIFSMTGYIAASGNIMSLIYGDDYEGKVELTSKYMFSNLFKNCTSLTSAPELPATTLASDCYSNMFYGCTSLTSAPPELPATTLASNCYNYMFYGCTSLTSAPPELPATKLANYCYRNMFDGCISLTSAPELPATTLVESCYNYMFRNCTSLTSAPELPATTLTQQCYVDMFYGCTSLTSAPELPATTLSYGCYVDMFYGCTSLTSAPELPATTLANYCYSNMFNGCTSLTSAPELPATTLSSGCYNNMFRNCTSLTSAPELPATTLASSCYNNMFYGCSILNYVKADFLTEPSTAYTSSWLYGVSSEGTFVANPEATWPSEITMGVSTVPSGWTIVTS